MASSSTRARRFSTRREVALGLGVYAAYLLVRRAVVNERGRAQHPDFHGLRRAAVLTTLGAQPVFLFFPVAPPRTLDEFVDTIEEVSGIDLDRGLIAQLYDPIAAMPSIHVAYAVVTAAGIATTSESAVARALAPAYPPVVAAVVVATANHYVLDAVAGGALALAGLRVARLFD
jgi:hypothetical protein